VNKSVEGDLPRGDRKTNSSRRKSRDNSETESRGVLGLGFCATGSQESTNNTVVVRPMTTKKVLKQKQLMMNTSMSTLPTAQHATSFQYMI